jgi:hypothetical protein
MKYSQFGNTSRSYPLVSQSFFSSLMYPSVFIPAPVNLATVDSFSTREAEPMAILKLDK